MEKQRHRYLTIWLVWTIITSALGGIAYLLADDAVLASGAVAGNGRHLFPTWVILVLAVQCAANVVFVIALFRWRKWGFYGIVGSGIIAAIGNCALGMSAMPAVSGLLSPAILYTLLQLGCAGKTGWAQLE